MCNLLAKEVVSPPIPLVRERKLGLTVYFSYFHSPVGRWETQHNIQTEKATVLRNSFQSEVDTSRILTHTKRGIVQTDLCEEVVSVCGVLLPKVTLNEEVWGSKILIQYTEEFIISYFVSEFEVCIIETYF